MTHTFSERAIKKTHRPAGPAAAAALAACLAFAWGGGTAARAQEAEAPIPDYMAHTVEIDPPPAGPSYLYPYGYYPYAGEVEVRFDLDAALVRTWLSPETVPAAAPETTGPGVAYGYYLVEWDYGNERRRRLIDFNKHEPTRQGQAPNITLAPRDPVSGKNQEKEWAMRWYGSLVVPETGVYTFTLRPYSCGRLFVSGRVVADSVGFKTWHTWRGSSIRLAAGRHPVEFGHLQWRANEPPEWPKELVRVTAPDGSTFPLPDDWLRLPREGAAAPERPWTADAEALFDKAAPPLPEALRGEREARVEVRSLATGDAVAGAALPLDGDGRGRAIVPVGELPEGGYRVVATVAGRDIPNPVPFERKVFPWERNELGREHVVYPPFTPVRVEGRDVHVVDRVCSVNALGGFDSVRAKGRELLAAPARLRGTDANGAPLEWTASEVAGEEVHPDEARFRTRAWGAAPAVSTDITVQEDGCARFSVTLEPPEGGVTLRDLWLEIPLLDREAPLFHYVHPNAMRLNFGGATPRGGRIVWESRDEPPVKPKGWFPPIWFAEPGPEDGPLWDSAKAFWHKDANDAKYPNTPFTHYIWLGAEERGLAWFGANDRGYVVNDRDPVQTLERRGDRVILKVHLVRGPARLEAPRTVVYGLQATPTKPLRADWRTRPYHPGVGPVICFGGYGCACKYPDNRDFTIAEKVVEARATGEVDEDWFEAYDRRRAWPDQTINDGPTTWLDLVLGFARRAASAEDRDAPLSIYFEENRPHRRTEEWQVFMDEWSGNVFPRFAGENPRSMSAPSYHDFAVYYAHEWLRRGIGLYFDNIFPCEVYTPRNSDAYVDPRTGRLRKATETWARRDYYKRVWKVMTRLDRSGEVGRPLGITHHMTNTRMAPLQTWCYGTLDLEQRWRTGPAGEPLPWPPPYIRAVSLGGQNGNKPMVLDHLFGAGRHGFRKSFDAPEMFREWGMQRTHEMGGPWMPKRDWAPRAWDTRLAADEFGYGRPGTSYHRYWDENPLLELRPAEQVKWWAMTREADRQVFLVLQSWSPDAVKVRLRLPGAVRARELFEETVLEATAAGGLAVGLPAPYGTRVFLVERADRP